MAKKVLFNQIIDYVSASCRAGSITFNVYTDDVKSGDNSAIEYLKKDEKLAFLPEKNYVLFHTTKHANCVGKSFEYKLRKFESQKDFFQFINLWDDEQNAKWITRLSSSDVKGDACNGSVYFLGIEYPTGREEKLDVAVLKVYFSSQYNTSNGAIEYFNDRFIEKIANCGIAFFKDVQDKIYTFIDIGFDIYMVGWNHDKVTKTNKYKIYFITSRKIDEDRFYKEIEEFSNSESLRNLTSDKHLYMRGFALCQDDKSARSVNIYYRGINERI